MVTMLAAHALLSDYVLCKLFCCLLFVFSRNTQSQSLRTARGDGASELRVAGDHTVHQTVHGLLVFRGLGFLILLHNTLGDDAALHRFVPYVNLLFGPRGVIVLRQIAPQVVLLRHGVSGGGDAGAPQTKTLCKDKFVFAYIRTFKFDKQGPSSDEFHKHGFGR